MEGVKRKMGFLVVIGIAALIMMIIFVVIAATSTAKATNSATIVHVGNTTVASTSSINWEQVLFYAAAVIMGIAATISLALFIAYRRDRISVKDGRIDCIASTRPLNLSISQIESCKVTPFGIDIKVKNDTRRYVVGFIQNQTEVVNYINDQMKA